MDYEEFKRSEDLKWQKERLRLEARSNKAYNEGLWNAVKWNPFKWWVFLMFRKPETPQPPEE